MMLSIIELNFISWKKFCWLLATGNENGIEYGSRSRGNMRVVRNARHRQSRRSQTRGNQRSPGEVWIGQEDIAAVLDDVAGVADPGERRGFARVGQVAAVLRPDRSGRGVVWWGGVGWSGGGLKLLLLIRRGSDIQ